MVLLLGIANPASVQIVLAHLHNQRLGQFRGCDFNFFVHLSESTAKARHSQGKSLNLSTRLAKPEEADEFLAWSRATPLNLFDHEPGLNASTLTFVSEDSQGAATYCPMQQAVFMEALAIRPGARLGTVAKALRDLALTAVRLAKRIGGSEVYAVCDEPTTQALMLRHGFEEIPAKIFRLKVKTAESLYGEQPAL